MHISASSPSVSPHGFPDPERRFLLLQPRIGDQVVQRLERAGFHSLRQLHAAGAASAVLRICEGIDSIAWANRRKPLERALARWAEGALAAVAGDAPANPRR